MRRLHRSALKIVAAYIVCGVLWIYFSDIVLFRLTGNDVKLFQRLQLFKGSFYVVFTSLLLYWLIFRQHLRLSRSEAAYMRIFKENPQPMWVYDVDSFAFLEVNEAAVRKYGYSREEFLNMTILDIRPPDEAARMRGIPPRTQSFSESGTWKHFRKDGSSMYVKVSLFRTRYQHYDAEIVSVWDVTDKHLADVELMQHKQLLHALINSSDAVIWAVDNQQRLIAFNEAFAAAIYQLTQVHVHLGITLSDAPFGRLFGNWNTIYKRAMLGEKSSLHETRELGAIGWKYAEVSLNPVKADGQTIGIAMFARNISVRKHNELRLQRALNRYNVLSRATNDAIWDWNLQTNKVVWNKRAYSVFKYREMSPSPDWWIENLHPEDRKRVEKSIQDTIGRGENLWSDMYRFRCGDGSYKSVYDRGYLIYNEHHKAVRMIGAMQDIQEKKEYEEEILKLSMVAKKTDNAVLINDREGRVEWVNESFTTLTGYTLDEVKGRRPWELLHGPDTDQVLAAQIRETLANKQSFIGELLNYHKSGRPYWIMLYVTPVLNEQGDIVSHVVIHADITERKRFIEQLEHRNRHLTEIAFISSHELRRPVVSLMGLMQLLDVENPANIANKEILLYFDQLVKELDRMIHVIAGKCNEVNV